MKRVIALVLILGLACPALYAAPGPDQKHVDKIKKKVSTCVEKGSRVSLETYDDRKLQGTISEAGEDNFVLTNEGRSTTLGYAEIKKIKSPMDRRTKGAIVTAIVLGGLLGLVFGAAATDN
ncbi:MAG TPA: hypothetical protein VHA33_10570 [Candidatus Angelobacter sp.]|jgi:hypothetical protein|nr:hypothetical protein [Candidatus Angelobacter sp.]